MSAETEEHLNDVAIIGMDARLPGAPSLERFWENLRDGVESVTFFSAEPPRIRNGVGLVPAGALVEDVELFDAAFFGFNPREAETMDPQIRLFLESAWAALERAGCDALQYPGRIGVFAGSAASTYLTAHLLPNVEVMRSAGGGVTSLGVFNDRDALATIVSYKLDLTGPSLTVQTFCSTGLVAVHLACQSLLAGESDIALAGASTINVQAGHGYLYQEGGIVSPDGHCRTFDAKAAGTVFGNGIGVVVLKRVADALAEGDAIHAVIRGSAINNDGARKAGYTAPSVVGQAKAIAEAMAVAQVSPDTIGYVEAHGTATALGDPIEIEALTQAFRTGTSRRRYCPIGSVKTNFGHLDRTAGIAALIKTVLMLEHRQLPPSLHFETPNPEIDFENSPFYVNTRLAQWKTEGTPRRAGVSSLGVGGTNAHVIVEEAPPRPQPAPGRPCQLLVVSARSESALEAATARLVRHLRTYPEQSLADVAFTLIAGRRRFEHRRAVVAESAERAAEALEAVDPRRVWTAHAKATERPVAFLFPGQGAQYAGMTRGLYGKERVYREALDACCERLWGPLGLDLRSLLFAPRERAANAGERLSQTALTQPALFAVEYALARQWMSWGVEPTAMIGHSIGEYVAAHLAGVLGLEDALDLVAERGRLMQSLPPGSMLAVPLPAAEARALLRGSLALAAVNSPSLAVVSGPTPEVEALEAELARRGLPATRLHTSHAFHSSMMDPILPAFRERVARVRLAEPKIPYVSNLTGTWITPAQAKDPGYWAEHLRGTVLFSDGLQTLVAEPDRVVVEVGPGSTLSTLARQHAPRGSSLAAVSSVRHPKGEEEDLAHLLGALGKLWLAGVKVDGAKLFAGEKRQRVELPTYPFERERYWIDPPAEPYARPASAKKDPADWFYAPVWKSAPPAEPLLKANGHGRGGQWLLFVDEEGLGDRLAERLREQAEDVITVRPGPRFEGSLSGGFRLEPTLRDDYDRLLQALGDEGRNVARIVHAFGVGRRIVGEATLESVARAQERGYFSLFHLAQALAKRGWSQPLQIKVLTSQMQDVLRDDAIDPGKSTVLGLAKVIPQEHHNVDCASVDVEPADAECWREAGALEGLLQELRSNVPGAVVAYRRQQRFVHGYEPLPLPLRERPLRLRDHGVYLVTGGLGGVTFVLAAYLAHVAKAKLVLTGRSRLPERSGWAAWREAHGDADPVSQRILRVETLEQLGADILVTSADVASVEEMKRAVAEAEARFGSLHGVIHGAGIVGGSTFRPLREIGPAECEAQFHPKVTGLLALDRALGGRALDFCILTSSLSSVLGGYGYGAYAAANVFMDAYARWRHGRGGRRWLSVNWDEWRLGERPDEEAGRGAGLARFAMSGLEGAGAFARLLDLEGVPQVVVSTGDLRARIEQWIGLVALRGAKSAEASKERPRHARPHLQNAYVAPGTPTEQKIARIWSELLGIEKVGMHDNFFDLGGHSLLAIQVVTRIKAEMNAEISVATLFEGPTVESLGRLIGESGESGTAFEQSSDRGRKRKEERRRQAEQMEGVR